MIVRLLVVLWLATSLCALALFVWALRPSGSHDAPNQEFVAAAITKSATWVATSTDAGRLDARQVDFDSQEVLAQVHLQAPESGHYTLFHGDARVDRGVLWMAVKHIAAGSPITLEVVGFDLQSGKRVALIPAGSTCEQYQGDFCWASRQHEQLRFEIVGTSLYVLSSDGLARYMIADLARTGARSLEPAAVVKLPSSAQPNWYWWLTLSKANGAIWLFAANSGALWRTDPETLAMSEVPIVTGAQQVERDAHCLTNTDRAGDVPIGSRLDAGADVLAFGDILWISLWCRERGETWQGRRHTLAYRFDAVNGAVTWIPQVFHLPADQSDVKYRPMLLLANSDRLLTSWATVDAATLEPRDVSLVNKLPSTVVPGTVLRTSDETAIWSFDRRGRSRSEDPRLPSIETTLFRSRGEPAVAFPLPEVGPPPTAWLWATATWGWLIVGPVLLPALVLLAGPPRGGLVLEMGQGALLWYLALLIYGQTVAIPFPLLDSDPAVNVAFIPAASVGAALSILAIVMARRREGAEESATNRVPWLLRNGLAVERWTLVVLALFLGVLSLGTIFPEFAVLLAVPVGTGAALIVLWFLAGVIARRSGRPIALLTASPSWGPLNSWRWPFILSLAITAVTLQLDGAFWHATADRVCQSDSNSLGYECPTGYAIASLWPCLLYLVPFAWLLSTDQTLRRAGLQAGVLGIARILAPAVIYILDSPTVGFVVLVNDFTSLFLAAPIAGALGVLLWVTTLGAYERFRVSQASL